MDVHLIIILSLAVVDAVVITVFYLWLRSAPPMDEKTLSASGAGLFGFVFVAFSFTGTARILYLATIGIVFALCYLQHMGKISKVSQGELK